MTENCDKVWIFSHEQIGFKELLHIRKLLNVIKGLIILLGILNGSKQCREKKPTLLSMGPLTKNEYSCAFPSCIFMLIKLHLIIK